MRLISSLVFVLVASSICTDVLGQSQDKIEITDLELLVLIRNFATGDGNELEFAASQIEELKKIATEAVSRNNELRKKTVADLELRKKEEGLEGADYERTYREYATKLREQQHENASLAMKEINEILVPSQVKALRQYGFRSRFRATLSPFKLLRIAYQQVGMEPKKLKQANQDLDGIQERYTRELEKLRQKTLKEIAKSLGEQDADKVFDLTGRQIFPPVR